MVVDLQKWKECKEEPEKASSISEDTDSMFEQLVRQNQQKKQKAAEERKKANNQVIRSYRLSPRK